MGIDNPLLTVERLSVALPASRPLVKDISFSMGQERLALVGESGSGKSLTARALMGLLPPPLQMQAQRLTLGRGRSDASERAPVEPPARQ